MNKKNIISIAGVTAIISVAFFAGNYMGKNQDVSTKQGVEEFELSDMEVEFDNGYVSSEEVISSKELDKKMKLFSKNTGLKFEKNTFEDGLDGVLVKDNSSLSVSIIFNKDGAINSFDVSLLNIEEHKELNDATKEIIELIDKQSGSKASIAKAAKRLCDKYTSEKYLSSDEYENDLSIQYFVDDKSLQGDKILSVDFANPKYPSAEFALSFY